MIYILLNITLSSVSRYSSDTSKMEFMRITLVSLIVGASILAVTGNDACNQPKVVGPCRAAQRRWFYDSASGLCTAFIYGGCRGNNNNFPTEKECAKTCNDVCKQPKKSGPCRAAYRRWFYDSTSGSCKAFTYGGCRGNGNNFLSKEKCNEGCICKQPKETGPCRAAQRRWFYDSTSGSCKKFIYGGCRGNDNNFSSRRVCASTCMANSEPTVVHGY